VKDEDIYAQIVDYSKGYPELIPGSLGEVTYAQLKTGSITVEGKKIPTGGISSYTKARKIARLLKERILAKKFLLAEAVALLPSADAGISFKTLNERPVKQK
jgi:uncharacterized protein (DUF39 family)